MGKHFFRHHGPHGDIIPRTTGAWAVYIADNGSAQPPGVADEISAVIF